MTSLLIKHDVHTLVLVLFTGNVTFAALVAIYYLNSEFGRRWKECPGMVFAKLSQAAAYLLISFRGELPDSLSVNIGNSLLFIGVSCESSVLLSLVDREGRAARYLRYILFASLAVFNAVDYIRPDSSLRVFIASIFHCALIFPPCLVLLSPKNATGFRKAMGWLYFTFMIVLCFRACTAFASPIGVLSSTPIQALTNHVLIMMMVFCVGGYLLLVKEEADRELLAVASTDHLTGIPNRFRFWSDAERMFARCKFAGRRVALLYIDIDNFKTINDRLGHGFGDAVLMVAAEVLRNNTRPDDLICRYGGEEFLAFLCGLETDTALAVAERIRRGTLARTFETADDFAFSVSVGIRDGVPDENDTLLGFINHADAALYAAKRRGRNRVVRYDVAVSEAGYERYGGRGAPLSASE